MKNAMNDDKLKKLKSVGFQWVTRKRPGKTQQETDEFKRDGVELDSDSKEETDGDDDDDDEEEEEEEDNGGTAHARLAQQAFSSMAQPMPVAAAAAAAAPIDHRQHDTTAGTHGLGPYFTSWDKF
jgi:TATA-binding protein-associated factor Taf7